MKALRLTAPRQFAALSISEPPAPGPGEVLVRTHRVGVCGTDLSAFLGKMPFFGYPRIPGHELGVEVLAVGSGVERVRVGDRCSVEPYMNCGRCLACRKGATNCCATLQVIGVMVDGGLCERFVVRADKLHVANDLAYEQLALVETLAIGRHAVERAGCRAGENVLVLGAGPIGLAVLEFVRLAGARSLVVDTNETRLDFAKRTMGVAAAVPWSTTLETQLRELTDGNLCDVVFDATGNSRSMSASFGYVAPTGRLVFVGITTEEVAFRHPPFHKLEGTLLCSRNALPHDFPAIIGQICDGRIDTRPWITHRTPFDAVIETFPSFTLPETGVVKAVIEVTA